MSDRPYDSSYEWPGDHDNSSSGFSKQNSQPCTVMRFIVLRSSILPKKQTIAVLDGYKETQLGRDMGPPGSETPRIRLKEMEVSKYHANVYWDSEHQDWAIVDMGSKHGTFLKSSSSSSSSFTSSPAIDEDKGIRVSPPRIASMPRSLHHLDQLTVGSTTFLIHLHVDGLPCIDCSLTDREEIPLFDIRRRHEEACRKRKREELEASHPHSWERGLEKDSKKALSVLKRSLLQRHEGSAAPSRPPPSAAYVDRSARRRALHVSSAPDTPGVSTPSFLGQPLATAKSGPRETRSQPDIPQSEPTSAPPVPVSSDNVGHRLLMKQGWLPGTTLGQADSDGLALLEPLEVSVSKNRAGLGVRKTVSSKTPPLQSEIGWREAAKRRRFEDLRAGDERG